MFFFNLFFYLIFNIVQIKIRFYNFFKFLFITPFHRASSVPSGPSAFLNVLETELLFATKAGVFVVQAAGNAALSFSPRVTSVASSIIDRKYDNTIILGN
jgi:hypothetical protein